MPEWFKKFFNQMKDLWGKWSLVQKIILFAVIIVVIIALVAIVSVSSSPGLVAVFNVPITSADTLFDIGVQLDEEGISYQTNEAGMIYVSDDDTARRARTVLMRFDLVPETEDPWDFFNVDRWSTTQFERDVNLRRSLALSLEQHITALNDIDAASVELVIPEDELFTAQQNPTTVSVIITPKPGSDISESRTKIEGLVKMIQYAVEGLEEDNIKILNYNGVLLNDFEDLADLDRLDITKRQMEQKQAYETYYKNTILNALSDIWSPERVRIVNLDITMDLAQRSIDTQEYLPIVMAADNPETPYSELEVQENIPIATQSSTSSYSGSGYNPNGPAGQEGQTPPQYESLENMVGTWDENTANTNYAVNSRVTHEEAAPWAITKITVGVALDGTWKKISDELGKPEINPDGSISREYTPVSDGVLTQAQSLVEHAIGYSSSRGDSVTVQHIQFDRSSQFFEEDDVYRKQMLMQRNILYAIIGVLVLGLFYVVFRLFSRSMERRRRLREEELSRQHQAMREAALRSAEEEGVDVEMSVQDRARMEMQENAINMAREHPEDVAQLIRTWLAEE